MSDKSSETTEMSAADFAQTALRDYLAPPSVGSVKARINYAARKLNWSVSRTRDVWYRDPRISLSADEIRQIEERTGLHYAQIALEEVDTLIDRADTLLFGTDPDFHSAFAIGLRAFLGALARSRAGRAD